MTFRCGLAGGAFAAMFLLVPRVGTRLLCGDPEQAIDHVAGAALGACEIGSAFVLGLAGLVIGLAAAALAYRCSG